MDKAPTTPSLSRRAILTLGLSTVGLYGCSFFSTEPVSEQSGTAGGGLLESPKLAERVATGELPPLDQRLPANPLVVTPNEQTGGYGGTWTTVLLGTADWPWLSRTVGYEALMRWSQDWKSVIPNVAESVEQSPDGREFSVTLREGLKWSDGEPFTAADVIFAYDDVHNNRDLYPSLIPLLMSNGEPMRINKGDDYHVTFQFAEPNGMFMQRCLAMKQGRQDLFCAYPKHYLERFHAKYNSNVEADARSAGFANWTELFLARATYWENASIPLLHPWIAKGDLGTASRFVLERNPYYFKTDPTGAQLPYLDEVSIELISDPEVILLKASNGELNFHTRHVMTPANKPVLARARAAGRFHLIDLKNTLMNELLVSLNLTHKDERLRALFRNKDVRIGLSHAINRDEINKAVFQGQGFVQQAAPVPDSEFWDEQFAKQYTEYDVQLANEFLDRSGMQARDADGFRLAADGRRISFVVSTTTGNYPWHIPGTELITQYWRAVGIDARQETVDRGLHGTRLQGNDFDASVFVGAGGFGEEMLEPRFVFPFSSNSEYAIPWASWFTSGGTSGEEPPTAVREQMRLYRTLEQTPDPNEQKNIFRRILAISREQFFTIGTLSVPNTYAVVADNFHNVPPVMIESDRYNTPGPTNPEQYFIQ